MKTLLLRAMLLTSPLLPATALAWVGFDADSADLVEMGQETVPEPGGVISVTNHDQNSTTECIVTSVRHNLRTVEVVVQYPDNSQHTLVMEGH